MKRDQSYLREILIEFEQSEDDCFVVTDFLESSAEEQKRRYHIQLLVDSGLMTEVTEDLFRMTSQGHDFLDAIRDEGIWAKTKAAALENGGSMAIEITKQIALGFLKKKLSQHTGLEL